MMVLSLLPGWSWLLAAATTDWAAYKRAPSVVAAASNQDRQ